MWWIAGLFGIRVLVENGRKKNRDDVEYLGRKDPEGFIVASGAKAGLCPHCSTFGESEFQPLLPRCYRT
jgi:hypothetical protein